MRSCAAASGVVNLAVRMSNSSLWVVLTGTFDSASPRPIGRASMSDALSLVAVPLAIELSRCDSPAADRLA